MLQSAHSRASGNPETALMPFFVYILASGQNWYELHESRDTAFRRERQLKKWNRAWKIELIERINPNWSDLACELI
jgi:hypothetical protein